MKPSEIRKVVRSAPGWALGRAWFREANGQVAVESITWVQVVGWEFRTGDTGTLALPVLALEPVPQDQAWVLRDPGGQIVTPDYLLRNEAQAFAYLKKMREECDAKAQPPSR